MDIENTVVTNKHHCLMMDIISQSKLIMPVDLFTELSFCRKLVGLLAEWDSCMAKGGKGNQPMPSIAMQLRLVLLQQLNQIHRPTWILFKSAYPECICQIPLQ